jgi:hypothetical protein
VEGFLGTVVPGVLGIAGAIMGSFIGVAIGPLAERPSMPDSRIRLRAALENARSTTDWHVLRWIVARLPRSPSDQNDGAGPWLIASVLFVVTLAAYVPHAGLVAGLLLCGALLIAGVTTATFVILGTREVIDGGHAMWRLLSVLVLAAIGTLNAVWLVHPVYEPHGLQRVQAALHAGHGIFSVGAADFGLVAYQLVGTAITFTYLMIASGLCVASVCAIYIEMDAPWPIMWLLIFWIVRISTNPWIWWTVFALGVLSLGLTSGFFAHLAGGG